MNVVLAENGAAKKSGKVTREAAAVCIEWIFSMLLNSYVHVV
ncbi:hypothetical protein [Klebsiella variicola]